MKKCFNWIFLTFSLYSLSLTCLNAKDTSHIKPFLLINWLETNQKYFGQCHPEMEDGSFILCDKTSIKVKELKELFSMDSKKLVSFIKSKDINLVVICSSKKGLFQDDCVDASSLKTQNSKEFKKVTRLHGQYKPLENTIYINSNASIGTLIHEYIHYLQFQNRNMIFEKIYKKTRVEVQTNLIARMDDIILLVKTKEKNKNMKGVNLLVKEMVRLSKLLKSFSKWQDLIDERSIFELYLIYEKELNISRADIDLAKKNMNFICKRSDLKKVLNRKYCYIKEELNFKGDYYQTIKNVIKEVRPKPSYVELDHFLRGLPVIPKNLKLKAKINILNKYIFETLKIKADESYLSRNNKDNILPDSALKGKQAHCVGLTILYLLAFEQYGINAGLVRMPSHVLVKACEKNICHNIETLKDGLITTDDFYLNEGIISKKLLEKISETSYLKKMDSPKDLLGSIYLSLGFIASSEKKWPLAELFYKKSIDHARGFAEGYSNLAGVYSKMNRAAQMRLYLKIAHKINPFHPATNLNLGLLEFSKKDFVKTREFYDKAILYRPNFFKAYILSARLFDHLGEKRKALFEYKKAMIVNPSSCRTIKKLLTLDITMAYRSEIDKKLDQLESKNRCY